MRSGLREKQPRTQKKKSTLVNNKKNMDYDEPHLALNEKMQPIQWIEQPIGALVVVGSLWSKNGIK